MQVERQTAGCRARRWSTVRLAVLGGGLLGGSAVLPATARAAIPEYRGVNDFGTYGFDTTSFKNSVGGTMKGWGVDIVREAVPNFDVVPLNTSSVSTSGGTLHGLQGVVNDIKTNVNADAVTVLCPFSWNNSVLSGATPASASFFTAYKTRLAAEATQFAGQSNVWLETWNEPYTVNSPATWLSDMQAMVSSIRTGTGFTGKIVVPGGNFDGNESPFLSQGQTLLASDPSHNLVFDLHAYSNVIQGQTEAQIAARIQTIQDKGLDLMFGEYGPAVLGTSNFDDVSPFLAAVAQKHVTALAWNWNDSDSGTLHNTDGSLNNTAANYNWANQALAYTQAAPALPEPAALATIGVAAGLLVRRRNA